MNLRCCTRCRFRLVALVAGCAVLGGCTSGGALDADPDGPCTSQNPCPAEEACTPDGLCVPARGEQPCAASEDCSTGEVCSAAGFCAPADDPDPAGVGKVDFVLLGAGDTHCEADPVCAEARVCRAGSCVRDPGAATTFATPTGCWRITSTIPDLGSAVVIYQFDDDGQLERTWEIDLLAGAIVEQDRFTVTAALFWARRYPVGDQFVAFDGASGEWTIATALVFYGVHAGASACLIDRTTVCGETALIEATLTGEPPDANTSGATLSGTIVRHVACVSTTASGVTGQVSYTGSVVGVRLDSCPDVADSSVVSQEEQGDACE